MTGLIKLPAGGGEPSLRQRIRRASSWGLVSRLVSAGTNLLLSALMIRRLGVHTYGTIATVFSFIGLIGFADLGIGAAAMTPLSVATASGDDARASLIITAARRAILRPAAALSAAGLVVLIIGALRPAYVINLPALGALLLVFGCNLPLAIGQRVLAARQRSDLVAKQSTVACIVALFITVGLLQVTHRLWLLVIGETLQITVASAMAHRATRLKSRPALTREVLRAVGLGRQSLVFLIISLAAALSYETDELVVAFVRGPGQVSLYDVHTRPFAVIYGLSLVAVGPFWAGIAAAANRHDGDWVVSTVGRLCATVGAASLALGGATLAILPRYVGIVSGHRLHFHLALGLWLVAWGVTMSVGAAVGAACNGLNLIRQELWAAIAITITNLGIGIPLTHVFGPTGPIVGTIFSQGLAVIWLLGVIRRTYSGAEQVMVD